MDPSPVQILALQGQPAIAFGTNLTSYFAKDLHATLDLSSRTVVIISDTHVAPLYMKPVIDALKPYASSTLSFTIPSGEAAKSVATKTSIDTFLLQSGCTRTTVLVALGGGMVTDMVGFVAATYMRGIAYVNLPTSLLGMVDASIGGKTGINNTFGKNLIGSFHLPTQVYIDTQFLASLPERHFRNGLAEMIKSSLISDAAIFKKYLRRIEKTDREALLFLMEHAMGVKLKLVNMDLKEAGVRAYLNYGHTIGHAVEWDTPDTLLHGECVAIGMVLEAKIAHWMGLLSLYEYHMIETACSVQGLPTTLPAGINRALLLQRMKIDKKASKDIFVVLLKKIGGPVLEAVPLPTLQWILSDACFLSPKYALGVAREMTIDVPGSKSITNRALILAALAQGTVTLTRVLFSLDTRVMLQALQAVGLCEIEYTLEGVKITGNGGKFKQVARQVYLENAGTAVRFLTACFTLSPYAIDIDGDIRMKSRPMAPLLAALVQNGCRLESLADPGYVPLRIHPGKMKGGNVKLDSKMSSQFVSAILMCAPYAESPVELELIGDEVVSESYIQMTIEMMRTFGIHVTKHSKYRYSVPLGTYQNPPSYAIEPDASSATYPLALAAISGNTVTVPGLGSPSLQGDARFSTEILRAMGCAVEQTRDFTRVKGAATLKALGPVSMTEMTDAFLTLAVLASVATGTTTITGIANQRVKECNRIHATVMELQRLGVRVAETPDGLEITGPTPSFGFHEVMCHNDHRIAMAFSLLATKTPLVIREKGCVGKTWPSFFETLVGTQLFRFSAFDATPQRTSIVLIGMRGVGKSTLGRAAADKLGMYFIDLDQVFESMHGSIPQFVRVYGWEAFRENETEIFKSMVMQYKKNCILATGGGVIETAEACQLLKTCGLHVVHLTRGWLPDVPSKKPIFNESDLEVFHRRLPRYECAPYEFVIPELDLGKKGVYNWENVQWGFTRHLERLEDETTVGPKCTSDTSVMTTGFVSLSCASIREVLPHLDTITHGADAIELRLDLLEVPPMDEGLLAHPLLHTFAHAFFTLRQFTELPILTTLRTENQGGKYPTTRGTDFIHLVQQKCIQWRTDFLDIELGLEQEFSPLLELKPRALRNKVQLLPSFHDPQGKLPWTSSEWTALVHKAKMLNPKMIKLVSYAHSPQANQDLVVFQALHRDVPHLLLINMGPLGRLTRLLSPWTPVTHPLLQATAPGQLSIKQVYQMQGCIQMRPRAFYLFGDPIHASPSPYMHTQALAFFGLDQVYTYKACQGPESVVSSKLVEADFGGASVTIPHKQGACKWASELDGDVQAIGAANTLFLHDGKLKAANTDWRALFSFLKPFTPMDSVCVLGAGGTARAVLYALSKCQPAPRQIVVCNRTQAKAEHLVTAFKHLFAATSVMTATLDLPIIPQMEPSVLINTLPKDAQLTLQGDLSNTHVVELAYRSDLRPILKQQPVKSITCGWEILVEQGIEQFKLWTGLVPPKGIMIDAVKEFFARKQENNGKKALI